jgi:hypothetical protein
LTVALICGRRLAKERLRGGGPAPHRLPLRLLPPQFVPMSPGQERRAVAALADLLLDYWTRHLAERGSPTPP